MGRSLVILIYNILLPIFFVLAFPAWLLKMWKRGGYGTGLKQRFGLFDEDVSSEPKDVVYIHAVSVGEVFLALKLIRVWLEKHPDEKVVLVPTTSTGHAVAVENAPEGVRVIYSPLDFGFITKSVFMRFQPKQIVLIEAETWPNLLNVARKMEIPVSLANARLSQRSERRFKKVGFLVRPLFQMLSQIAVQEKEDVDRWTGLGVDAEKIVHTGSVKFDYDGGAKPQQREEFQEIISALNPAKKPVVIAISTFAGEEKAIIEAIGDRAFPIIVPRHMERREEVVEDLSSVGWTPVLRSTGKLPSELPEEPCFVVDTTGELRDWTAHADLAIVGKSWQLSDKGKGGQNPTEAVAARVPVITGKRMDNFEPLVGAMVAAEGIQQLETIEMLPDAIDEVLSDSELAQKMVESAAAVLAAHDGATVRTVEALKNENRL